MENGSCPVASLFIAKRNIKVYTNTHLVFKGYKLGSFVKFVQHWLGQERAKL